MNPSTYNSSEPQTITLSTGPISTVRQEAPPDTPLDTSCLAALHRDPTSFLALVRKPEHAIVDRKGRKKQFENIASVCVGDLFSEIPPLIPLLSHDSYVSVNGYKYPAPYPNKLTGKSDVWRKEKHLSKLNSCYVDIDCGRPESDVPGGALFWRDAQIQALLLMRAGILPYGSMYASSGRGMYLFYLLHDIVNPRMPPQATKYNIRLYKAINRTIGDRMRQNDLPADVKAIDAARVLRIPNSIHRLTGNQVRFVIEYKDDGKIPSYTLAELAAFLNVEVESDTQKNITIDGKAILVTSPKQRKTKKLGSVPKRINGRHALNRKRLNDLFKINNWRGGYLKRGMKYPDGTSSPGRRNILRFYAVCFYGCGIPQTTTLDYVRNLASTMKPVYPSDSSDESLSAIVASVYSDGKIQYYTKTLLWMFGIDAQAARRLALETIRPDEVAIEEKKANSAATLRLCQQARRLALAKTYIAEQQRLRIHPTCRELAKFYACHQISASHNIANRDLHALGVGRLRGRPKQGKKPA